MPIYFCFLAALFFFFSFFFFFNDTATTEIYTLSLHDALPIGPQPHRVDGVPSVRADLDPESPVGVVGSLVNQAVGGLVRPQLVIVDLLVAIQLEQRIGAGSGLGVAAVEKPRAIVR